MSWYSQIVATYGSVSPSPFPALGTAHLLEVILSLGASVANNTALAALTAPSGLLASAALQLALMAVLEDEDAAGNTQSVPPVAFSALMSLNGTGAPGAFLSLRNTCPGGVCAGAAPAALLLYGVVDFSALVVGIDAPSPGRPGFTRRLVAKVVSGASVVGVSPPSMSFTVNGVPYSGVLAIMGAMDTGTNCFPTGAAGALPSGCTLGTGVSVDTTVYAAPGVISAPCVHAHGALTTPCQRSFMEPAPARMLLYLQDIAATSYTPGTGWVPNTPVARVAYLTHGHSAGVRIPLTAPCFPAPSCPGEAGTTLQAWTIILIVVIAAAAFVTGFAMWALRRPLPHTPLARNLPVTSSLAR